MASLTVTERSGSTLELEIDATQNFLEVISGAGNYDLEAICGGSCACATCHVYVDEASMPKLSAVSEDEKMLLEGTEHYDPERSRLACQTRVIDESATISVSMAPEG